MFMRKWIRSWLTRRSVWPTAGCALVLIPCVLAVLSQRQWQQRAAVLEGCAVGALTAMAAMCVIALLAFKRYVRRRKSVDDRYKAIIDQANDGIVIVHVQSQTVLYANPAFLSRLGYTSAEAPALSLRDIFADGTAAPDSVLMRLRGANSQMALNMQLQEVATRLRAVVRDSDVVIRMGGDEFVVVFCNVKSYDEVTLGAGRIIETLNRPIIIDEHPLQTTGSVGVSLFPRDGSNMVELLKHSDTAMYQAKDRGRNNVQMFSPAMNRKLKHRVAVEASLREALRLKQLDVHYQPFINLATRQVVGLEALMRWRHPVHGMVPADQFIPVAEETGLIVPMGNFVLHRALQNMSSWRKAGARLVPMSLNIAPAQLQRRELQSTIATLLKTHGLRPELLQLEMTEPEMLH